MLSNACIGLVVVGCSSFAVRCLLFVVRRLSLFVFDGLLIVLSIVTRCGLLVVCCLFVVYGVSLFVVRCMLSVVRYFLSVVCFFC